MNDIILSTLQKDLSYLIDTLNFLDYISDCFCSSSVDFNLELASFYLYCAIKDLDDLIYDIQLGNTSFENK